MNELEASPTKQRSYDAAIRRLEGTLGTGPYLLGEQFSAADILVASGVI